MIQKEPFYPQHLHKKLPDHLKVGYANWGECDDKIMEAVENGLNMIIWFSIDLAHDPITQKPTINRGPDYSKVAEMIKRINDKGYHQVIHLLSIGGWNSPHPDNRHTAEEYLEEWLKFNERISMPSLDFYGFDGFDWDIEGHDDMSSPNNHFNITTLDIMGRMSQLAKRHGYIVAMAPSESYLDPTTSAFSLSLLHNHPEWEKEMPKFTYHGRNVYAYLLQKYGQCLDRNDIPIRTFDFISIQLYEGYSHTLYHLTREHKPFGEILYELLAKLVKGWEVDFSQVKETQMPQEKVTLNSDRIVIGLANAWANNQFLFISEKEMIEAADYLKSKQVNITGFMFWNIQDEGLIPHDSDKPYYLAKILNKIFS